MYIIWTVNYFVCIILTYKQVICCTFISDASNNNNKKGTVENIFKRHISDHHNDKVHHKKSRLNLNLHTYTSSSQRVKFFFLFILFLIGSLSSAVFSASSSNFFQTVVACFSETHNGRRTNESSTTKKIKPPSCLLYLDGLS